jgi:hypothetical protein
VALDNGGGLAVLRKEHFYKRDFFVWPNYMTAK